MKRLLILLLAALLLTGCVGTPVQTTDPTQTPSTEPPTIGVPVPVPGDPDSTIRQQTAGAVTVYPQDWACLDMTFLGEELLLSFDNGVAYTASLGDMTWSDSATLEGVTRLHSTENGVWYYQEESRTVVTVTTDLQNTRSILLPEGILGWPGVSNDLKTVFYCTQEGIRALNVETGIASLLRQEAGFTGVQDMCFNGEMLLCATDEGVAFIMASSGIQVDDDMGLYFADTHADTFFLLRDGEEGAEYLFGSRSGDMRVFLAPENGNVCSALALGGIVTVTMADDVTVMDFYELSSGLRTASVSLENVTGVRNLVADKQNGCIWFLANASQYTGDVLLCWKPAMSPVEDPKIYTAPYYTAAKPDVEGLNACVVRAQAIGSPVAMDVRVWMDAVAAPWQNGEAEYHVSAIHSALDTLEAVLARFPEGMLAQLGTICDSGKVSVSLLAELGDESWRQVWLNGDACIAVEQGDDLETALYYGIYKVMDTYVLGQNSMLDEWKADNPAQDRAEVFVHAMMEDMESYFSGKAAQNELKLLCKAIRDAFDLKKYEGELLWEQYLN